MIKARKVLYSRTLTDDYRWLILAEDSVRILQKDFDLRSKVTDKKNVFVRYVDDYLAIYSVVQTSYKDQFGRSIDALVGVTFEDVDKVVIERLLDFLLWYFLHTNQLYSLIGDLEQYSSEDDNRVENFVEISLEEIIALWKESATNMGHMLFPVVNKTHHDFYVISCNGHITVNNLQAHPDVSGDFVNGDKVREKPTRCVEDNTDKAGKKSKREEDRLRKERERERKKEEKERKKGKKTGSRSPWFQ